MSDDHPLGRGAWPELLLDRSSLQPAYPICFLKFTTPETLRLKLGGVRTYIYTQTVALSGLNGGAPPAKLGSSIL